MEVKNKYILQENKLYRCNKEYENTTLRLIEMFKDNFITELILGKEQLPELFTIILPKIKMELNLKI